MIENNKHHKQTVLVVEDEETIRNFMAAALTANGYKVIKCKLGKEAITLIPSHLPDIVLLDLGLPDMDGLTLLEQVRAWSDIPILIVSARDEENQKVKALDIGADDYITKPFGTSELLARIRTAIRHHEKRNRKYAQNSVVFQRDGLVINYDKREVTVDGEIMHLTQIEFKIVSLLANSAGKVLTYDAIISEIWGPYAMNDNQILRVNMANIRRKIEKNTADPKYIFTEIGIGYRMTEEDI